MPSEQHPDHEALLSPQEQGVFAAIIEAGIDTNVTRPVSMEFMQGLAFDVNAKKAAVQEALEQGIDPTTDPDLNYLIGQLTTSEALLEGLVSDIGVNQIVEGEESPEQ